MSTFQPSQLPIAPRAEGALDPGLVVAAVSHSRRFESFVYDTHRFDDQRGTGELDGSVTISSLDQFLLSGVGVAKLHTSTAFQLLWRDLKVTLETSLLIACILSTTFLNVIVLDI